MDVKHSGGVDVYRIGWWTHRWWPTRHILRGLLTGHQPTPRADNGDTFVGRRKYLPDLWHRLTLIRRPHRPWQAEWDGCQRAPRAWTRNGALAKALRLTKMSG